MMETNKKELSVKQIELFLNSIDAVSGQCFVSPVNRGIDSKNYLVSVNKRNKFKYVLKIYPEGTDEEVKYETEILNKLDSVFNKKFRILAVFDNEKEIETVWSKLIEGGQALMPYDTYPWARKYGWLKDKYGGSWQIVPSIMHEMMTSGDQEKIERVTQAFLKMKKFDVDALKRTYDGLKIL